MALASVPLLAFALHNYYEGYLQGKYAKKCQPYPVPAPGTEKFPPHEVSLVIASIEPPDALATALVGWIKQRPREIIVVTIPRDRERIKQLALQAQAVSRGEKAEQARQLGEKAFLVFDSSDDEEEYTVNSSSSNINNEDVSTTTTTHERPQAATRIIVLTAPEANQRLQQGIGFKRATGKIIVMTDDDTFSAHDSALRMLVAPFEESDHIGGVVGKVFPQLTPEPGKLSAAPRTAWAAIAARQCVGVFPWHKVQMGSRSGRADCILGAFGAARADVLQREDFLEDFLGETWRNPLTGVRHRSRTGNDSFMGRWLHYGAGKRVVLQSDERAAVTTLIPTEAAVQLRRLARWGRTGHKVALNWVVWRPGLRGSLADSKWTTKGQVLGLVSSWFKALHVLAWLWALDQCPAVGVAVTAWYAYLYVSGYWGFLSRYPQFRGWYTWVVLFGFDTVGQVLMDLWCWLTFFDDSWGNRDDSVRVSELGTLETTEDVIC